MSDVLARFSCLDELTQVIYQGICKYVVISTVSDDKWNVHVGLSGQQGRWWQGSWTEDDIHQRFGAQVADDVLELCAERLADFFVKGDICISDWSSEKGASIKFTVGPASKKPMHVPLVEMSAEGGAAHATQVFIDIALQAQSRKCRLYPSSVDYPETTPLQNISTTVPMKRRESSPEIREAKKNARTSNEAGSSHRNAEHAHKPATTAHVMKAARPGVKTPTSQQAKSSPAPSVQKPATALARRAKGASLANPNMKARKYQAIQFESDEDE